MGFAPRPVARRPAHDAWSRRWGTILGVTLVLGALAPVAETRWAHAPPDDLASKTEAIRLIWPWDAPAAAQPLLTCLFGIPLGLGVFALVVAWTLRPARRAATLLAVSLTTLVVGSVLLCGAIRTVSRDDDDLRRLAGHGEEFFALGCVVAAFPLASAVGNHLLRRFPESRAARRMCGVGASISLVWLSFAADFMFQGDFGRGAEWNRHPMVVVVLVTAAGYGILGVLSFFDGARARVQRAAISILGRVLLVALPLSIVAEILGAGHRDWLIGASAAVKATLLAYGHGLLIAVGVAAWIEATLVGRSPPEPLDDVRADQVFG